MRYFQSQSTIPSSSESGCPQEHVAMTPSGIPESSCVFAELFLNQLNFMFCLAICVASESCSEQKSAETEAAMPDKDINITDTSPDLDNSYGNMDMVPEKVSIPESFYSHLSRKKGQTQPGTIKLSVSRD